MQEYVIFPFPYRLWSLETFLSSSYTLGLLLRSFPLYIGPGTWKNSKFPVYRGTVRSTSNLKFIEEFILSYTSCFSLPTIIFSIILYRAFVSEINLQVAILYAHFGDSRIDKITASFQILGILPAFQIRLQRWNRNLRYDFCSCLIIRGWIKSGRAAELRRRVMAKSSSSCVGGRLQFLGSELDSQLA